MPRLVARTVSRETGNPHIFPRPALGRQRPGKILFLFQTQPSPPQRNWLENFGILRYKLQFVMEESRAEPAQLELSAQSSSHQV